MSAPQDDPRARARQDLSGFLSAHRARITPEDVGLPAGPRRRVAGLRREEVALLAGISVEYYSRLERGRVGQVSSGVVDALVSVLRLDAVEQSHLHELIRTAQGVTAPRTAGPSQVRPELLALLARMPATAAFVRNARLDLLGGNDAARALYRHVLAPGPDVPPRTVPNIAWSLFLDPRSRTFYRRWEDLADGAVGTFRAELARSPQDEELVVLVTDLERRSEDFRERWGRHEVDVYRAGRQEFHDELVGDLSLRYEALDVVADPGLTIIAYHADPGAPEEDSLRRLAESTGRPTA